MISREFWQGKRVFLTGHSGFKGSWMTLMLNQLNASVTGYSLPPNTTPSMFNELQVGSKCEKSIFGDVNDLETFSKEMKAAEPDIMIHMAAQPIVSVGYQEPIETFRTNVMGTVNFLEACRSVGRGLVLVISSDKCYKNNDYELSFHEDMPLGGKDPYSASKAATELVVRSWQESFFDDQSELSLCSARAGNVIGGGDWAENRLLPDICNAFHNQSTAVLRNPNSTRPWQHVLEPLTAYLNIIEWMQKNPHINESWNVGPRNNSVKTVGEIADLCAQNWPSKNLGWENSSSSPLFKENKKLDLDCSKIEKLIGWKPKLSIQEAVNLTIVWYHTYFAKDGYVLHDLTRSQIDKFLANQ